jgi:hypothetical protein
METSGKLPTVLQKLAGQVNGKVHLLKYSHVTGYCITDQDNNEIMEIQPCYSGFKWTVINRNGFNSELIFINDLRELKNQTLKAGFTGTIYKN